jgi:UDPglucose--hexose-1-phosphate uridylyltransferase
MARIANPEYRRCPVTGRWVVLAPERALRPIQLPHGQPHLRRDAAGSGVCPFCPGNEAMVPAEVFAVRDAGTPPDGPGWKLRVVPNKFPAVRELPDSSPMAITPDGFSEAMIGFGRHEVVIETDQHESDPVNLTDDEFVAMLTAYRERLKELAKNPRFAFATVFKNVGAEAGASLAHLHSQIIAMPVVPDAIRAELEAANDYYRRERRCVYCDLLRNESASGLRVVEDAGGFLSVCPFAPRFAYETWVLPQTHDSRFETTSDADLLNLARQMKRVLKAIDVVLNGPAYNWYLHAGPLRASNMPYYHWHIEIAPKTARPAGFEYGSGCFINAVPPELAAVRLRAAKQ